VEVFLSNGVTGNFSSRSAVNATFDYSVAGQTTLKAAYNQPTVYRYTDALITQIVDPLGRTTTQAWHASTNPATGAYQRSLQTVTDARGLVTSYAYDAQGNIVQTQLVGDIDGDTSTNETVTTTASYNLLNQPLTSTDASGITTTYTYADANFPYLPTQVTRSKTGASIRTDRFEYANQADATTPATQFSRGLLVRQTVAMGTADEAVDHALALLSQEAALRTRPHLRLTPTTVGPRYLSLDDTFSSRAEPSRARSPLVFGWLLAFQFESGDLSVLFPGAGASPGPHRVAVGFHD
jgi:YD repeat-containing protein